MNPWYFDWPYVIITPEFFKKFYLMLHFDTRLWRWYHHFPGDCWQLESYVIGPLSIVLTKGYYKNDSDTATE